MLNQKDFELPDFELPSAELDTEGDDLPEPAADEAEPEIEETETADEAPEDEIEETEDEEAGEPEESDEEDAAETEETADEAPADLEELPHFDRKSIEGKPELELAYKHMQRSFTRAMQDTRAKEREANMAKEELDTFVAELQSDEGATDFLVQLAMVRPKVFEAAYERAISLNENESERSLYEERQALKNERRELDREKRRRDEADKEERGQAIVRTIRDEAAKLGLSGAQDIEIAEHYVANVILEKRARGEQTPSISPSEIRAAVERAAASLSKTREAAKLEAERRVRAEMQQVMKAKAKDAKRPPAPKQRSPGQKSKKIEVPRGVDPLDHIIKTRLGL